MQVSERTVIEILGQNRNSLKTSSSGKRGKTNIFLDHLFRKDLQRIIWDYNQKNEFFTLDMLLANVRDNLEFEGGRTTLFRIMKSMGYKYKLVNGRKILCEQKHVVAAKIIFLRNFLQLKQSSENVTFVYLDETWIYQNGSAIRQWMHESDIKSNPSKIKCEGKRFTVLHAGCHLGFLKGCDMLLGSGNNDRDYHKTMNGEIFQNWVVTQLIPALAKVGGKCVVIMDNAPYHSMQVNKLPTFSSTKNQMQEWLINHNVKIEGKNTKKQLWDLIKPFRDSKNKLFVVDEILKEHGHEVLRLPPYHCQYNPIEKAWGFCKNYYNKHINSQPYSKDKVANLWLDALSKCTPDMWQNFCKHCETLISEEWVKFMENISIENIPPFIISLTESDDDSDCCSDVMEVE